MADNTEVPPCNIVRFPTEDCRAGVADCVSIAPESWDRGPSPEESLRIMRAFVGIKNRKLRSDMIEMLEGASRARGQAPCPAKE